MRNRILRPEWKEAPFRIKLRKTWGGGVSSAHQHSCQLLILGIVLLPQGTL